MTEELLARPVLNQLYNSEYPLVLPGMYSAGKRRGKHQKRVSPKPHRSSDIQRFLLNSLGASPITNMADATRHDTHTEQQLQASSSQMPLPNNTNMDFTIPALFRSESQELSQPSHTPLTLRADAELRALLQALQMRADIEAIVSRLEASHHQEIAVVRQEVQTLSDRMDSGESSVAALEWRLSAVEASHTIQANTILTQQLQLEEIEDRSRRNNLRLRGLPEAIGTEDLAASTLSIFRDMMGELFPPTLSFDQIHRALGPGSADPYRPRDVICRIHQYTHKELVLQTAWEKERLNLMGPS